MEKMITCQRCGKKVLRQHTAQYCEECAKALKYARARLYRARKRANENNTPSEKLITCKRCGKQELRHVNAVYCWDCINELARERNQRNRDHKRTAIDGGKNNGE